MEASAKSSSRRKKAAATRRRTSKSHQSPPAPVEEHHPATSWRHKVRMGLTPRILPKLGKSEEAVLLSAPQTTDTPLGTLSMKVQKLPSGLISPRKARGTVENTPVVSLKSTLDPSLEAEISKKYPMVRQSSTVCIDPSKTMPITSIFKPRDDRKRINIPLPSIPRVRLLQPLNRREELISVKEAMRDKEWLGQAKEGILQSFHSLIQQSFGLAVCAEGLPSAYRYYLGQGNNAQLVKKTFNSRWWWTRVEEDDKLTSNLVWTQWKEKDCIQALPTAISPTQLQQGESQVSCSLRYNPGSGPYRLSVAGRSVDLTPLGFDLILKSPSFVKAEPGLMLLPGSLKTHNKLENNHHLANKKALFINMKQYFELLGQDPFASLPLTFHIKDGELDPEFRRFEEVYAKITAEAEQESDPSKKPRNIWIIKPGENTNRGTGISVCGSIEQIKEEMKTAQVGPKPGVKRTFILQRYLDRPYLINKRKFDIRLYALITCANGILQGYYYSEGYIRTSSKEFSLSSLSNKLIHLTNDAVQKNSEDYGKFEMANKLSYSDFQRYLDAHSKESPVSFSQHIVPQLKALVKDSIQAVYLKLDKSHRLYSFEVFGYDFMLDEALKPWLIEVNTNPCLELSSPLLARVIPSMLENAFR